MSSQSVRTGLVLLVSWLWAASAGAGYYNTTDAEQETRWSPDYDKVFQHVLADLKLIPNPQPGRDPAIRRRYLLMETLGRKGDVEALTLADKLNYSAVLIRRDRADEAAQLLVPLAEEHRQNFVVLAHCATAHFLASNEDFRRKSAGYMKLALKRWPERWSELKDEQKDFLISLGWEETAFERNRRYETYFERLVKHRLEEESHRKQKLPIEEGVDPLFLGTDARPVRFVNESGKFEPGRIAEVEKKKLPRDAVEAVEQLLIWMPRDDRLLWLLAEVLNARAMELTKVEAKHQTIRNAHLIYTQLMTEAFNGRSIYGRKELKDRLDVLDPYVKKLPDPRDLDPDILPPPPEGALTNQQWMRALMVGFITGFAVGLFALWQFQEMRRRRQARLMSPH